MSDEATSTWTPVTRIRTHEQVMAQIEERILRGDLKMGDRLPAERELAAMLGVSRPSLRESLRVLEALGVLDIRRGGGGEGGAFLTGHPGDGLVNPLTLQLALGHFTHREVLDTRLALESWSCEHAAAHATADDLAELQDILDRMDDPALEAVEFNALDALFHVRIAAASGNTLNGQFMSTLRRAINRQMVEAYAGLDDWRATATTVRTEHRAILDAISRGDGAAARDHVIHHITSFYASATIADYAPERSSP